MYEQYFGFTRTPFRLESEPDMFFFGESQKNVLECIKNSLFLRKGIITLSGLPGSGKTTVMRRAIEESIVPDTIICRINRSRCKNFLDTLKTEILARQKISPRVNLEDIDLHQLVVNAVEEKKHFLVVVDESQQLTESEVDELFSLVDIEKDSRKHFKFLLVSHQPFHEYFDLAKYANSNDLLSNHCFLLPLLHEEILPYIEHRLTNTDWQGTPAFSKDIQHMVFLITQGIPRRINSFFDRLMLFSFFEKNDYINEEFVKIFCQDLLAELDSQSHPDLDSFDLRQALRRERRLFSRSEAEEAALKEAAKEASDNVMSDTVSEVKPIDDKQKIGEQAGDIEKDDGQDRVNDRVIDEPLASDDPEALLLFVSSFIKNPERYKNYTDQYYKVPKNLTLLLCLATETDRYIDDITPAELELSTAADIKIMIAEFVEKMLITSRFDKHRVLGLDAGATEEEINRHFSYMMRLCRSEYVKSDKQEFESIIKDAYIKLLSDHNDGEDEIPVVEDILVAAVNSEDTTIDEFAFNNHTEQKLAELEKAKSMLSRVGAESNDASVKSNKDNKRNLTTGSASQNSKKKSIAVPVVLTSLATAASIGYILLGTSIFSKPESQLKPNSILSQSEIISSTSTSSGNISLVASNATTSKATASKATNSTETDNVASVNNGKKISTMPDGLTGEQGNSKNDNVSQLVLLPEDMKLLENKTEEIIQKQKEGASITENSSLAVKSGPEFSLKEQALITLVEEMAIESIDAEEDNLTAVERPLAEQASVAIKSTTATENAVAINKTEQIPVSAVKLKVKPKNIKTPISPNELVKKPAKTDLSKKTSTQLRTIDVTQESSGASGILKASFDKKQLDGNSVDDSQFLHEKASMQSANNNKNTIANRKTSKTGNAIELSDNVGTAASSIRSVDTQTDLKENVAVDEKKTQLEKMFLERVALDRVVNNLKYSYENGDIEELSTLFVENAVTNNGFNKEQILDDYESLFDGTDKRAIKFSNIAWDISDKTAIATGQFVTIVESSSHLEKKEGTVSIKVVSAEETKKITELFFLYQLAEAE